VLPAALAHGARALARRLESADVGGAARPVDLREADQAWRQAGRSGLPGGAIVAVSTVRGLRSDKRLQQHLAIDQYRAQDRGNQVFVMEVRGP
jgi:hypothetical protein